MISFNGTRNFKSSVRAVKSASTVMVWFDMSWTGDHQLVALYEKGMGGSEGRSRLEEVQS